ncbi:acyltransferase family protein [Gluconacetobacter sp. Hr-1-5]|uniref:acyltransferase family protein n=1 Tax=Gluconacetobacter sp. Hr-1-5 TaxID=3395370 RepID=UPI003B529668
MLQMLRMLVGLSIFAGHWSEPYVGQLWPQGQIAIDIFFMIEGFIAMGYLARPAVAGTARWRIVASRIAHIYPIYALALVAGFCSFTPLALTHAQGWTIANWLAAFFSGLVLLPFFSTLVHGSVFPLNPPSWAIVLELFGFALLAYLRVQKSPGRLLALWIGAASTYLVLGAFWRDPNAGWATVHYWGGWPRMIMGFAGGALLWHLHSRYGARTAKIPPLGVLALFIGMHLPKIHLIGWPLLGLGVPLLVWSAASCARPAWLEAVAPFAERNTLALYLLGYPVMMLWRFADSIFTLRPAFAGSAAGFALVLGSLLAASVITMHLQKTLGRQAQG